MKTRTKIIWICLGYLLWGSYAIYRIVQFINGHDGILDLIVGLLMCVSLIYCISDSFVDHDGYSISSEGFLPALVDIMVI